MEKPQAYFRKREKKMANEFVVADRLVVMNFSVNYCKNEIEVLNSDCFEKVWLKYMAHIEKIGKRDIIDVFNKVPKPEKDFITLFKMLFTFPISGIRKNNEIFLEVLAHQESLYELVENFYDYWRKLERYSTIYAKASTNSVENSNFIESTNAFNEIILNTYRTISQKVYGQNFSIYRQVPAGVNAALLIDKLKWMSKDSPYAGLRELTFINSIIIRPPFISYSAKNKRTGTYPEIYHNPLVGLELNEEEYYCYPARVGSALAFVYFHRDYLSHGITLCNLFQFVPRNQCEGVKPDIVYLFGAPTKEESAFYHDKENDIYVGIAPHDNSVDYFGYMKKMLLTLYNVMMINKGFLPIHGACVNITMKNGMVKNAVIIGDSGAGKSESLEALTSYAGDNISNMVTIFDDMGTFKIVDGEVMAYGTEIGAFVRLDDMASGYAYREMDRAIFMNPDKINSRLVIPVATYPQIMKGYKVDIVLYANNFDDLNKEMDFFSDVTTAKNTFIRGARKAKGTTQEIGLVESFFANPFGPVQREEQTRAIIDTYFNQLFEDKVPVGQIYTRLAIPGYEHEGPAMVAKKFFEFLEK